MSLEDKIDALTKALEANTAALAKIAGAAKAATGGAKAETTKAETNKPATTKAPSDDDLRTAFGGYLSTGGADGKAARKANIQAILDHYEAKQVTDLAKDKRAAALADLVTFKNDGTPEWADGAGGDEDDNMLG